MCMRIYMHSELTLLVSGTTANCSDLACNQKSKNSFALEPLANVEQRVQNWRCLVEASERKGDQIESQLGDLVLAKAF